MRLHFEKWDSRDWWTVTGNFSEPGSVNHHSLEGMILLTAGSLTTLTFQASTGNITATAIQVFIK